MTFPAPARSSLGAFVRSPLGVRGPLAADAQLGGYVIAGVLTGIGGNVAIWDAVAEEWSALGSLGTVVALAWFDGYLWAGVLGSAPAYAPLARWDGSTWQTYTLGTPYSAAVTLTVHDGELYALASAEGSVTQRVYRYDAVGDAWSAHGSAFAGLGSNAPRRALFGLGGELYVQQGHALYRWDTSIWTDVDTGDELRAPGNLIGRAAVVDALAVFAGGNVDGSADTTTATLTTFDAGAGFALADDTLASGSLKWFTEFQDVASTDDVLSAAASWSGGVWAGGGETDGVTLSRGVLRTDGAGITRPIATDAAVWGVAAAPAALLIGGEFTTAGGVSCDRVALYDGTTVTAFAEGPSGGAVFECLALSGADAPPDLSAVADTTTPTGSAYTETLTLASGTVTTWALVTAPSGATIDGAGAVTWSTPVKAGSPHAFTVYASNDTGFDTESWTVTVQDTAPVIDDKADAVWFDVAPYSAANSLDSGDTPVTWSLDAGPAGFTVDASTGAEAWASPVAGTYTITVRAENAVGADTMSYELEIQDL